MEQSAPEITPAKGFKSIAQLRRCDGLVEAGTVTREIFERDLLATDLDNTPWRVGPAKEGDNDAEYLAEIRARQTALLTASTAGKSGFQILVGGAVIATIDLAQFPDASAAREYARNLAEIESGKNPNNAYSVRPFGEGMEAHGAFGRG